MNLEELVEKIIKLVDGNKNYEDIDYDTLRKELLELLREDKSK